MPPPALGPYLVLQRALDRDVLANLRQSATRTEAALARLVGRTGVGAEVRRTQLRQSLAEMHKEQARLWAALGDVVEAGKAQAAAAGAETTLAGASGVLEGLFSADDRAYMTRSVRQSAVSALQAAEERISGTSYVPLAESVYQNAALASGHIDNIVNAALARGASAAELAKDVRAFINPNTPGGVRYAAMRLGRTELNNSFHAAQVRQAQRLPWVTGVTWHLSGSHPRPDACNDYADVGFYDAAQVPPKPHPNCLCYTTPVTVPEDVFQDQLLAGAYDDYLDGVLPGEALEEGKLVVAADTGKVPAANLALPPTPPITPPPPPAAAVPSTSAGVETLPKYQPRKIETDLDRVRDARMDMRAVNPGYGTTAGYSENCAHVVQAQEMRRRGFDVTATPLDDIANQIKTDNLGSAWRAPDGSTRQLATFTDREAQEAIEALPVGGRGWLAFVRRGSGGHVIAVENTPLGLNYLDGQVAKAYTDFRAISSRSSGNRMFFMRTDDLTPTDDVMQFLREGTNGG